MMGSNGRRRRLAMTLGATLALVAGAASAQAATTGPTAIGQDAQGVSYVGFASGTTLMRFDASGAALASIPLDQPAPVDGISVDPGGHVWVDYGSSVSELTSTGGVVSHFTHAASPTCANDAAHDPARYGGIAVTGSTVYVAGRCNDSVEAYSRSGTLLATVQLPAGGYPRGIAYGVAQNGQPAKLYVALPDVGKVVTFNADTLSSSSQPINTLTPATPGGGTTPAPGGVFTDIYGQLVVTDMANNAVYFYDTNNNYSFYRTLGHPPGPGSSLGSLNTPTALAVHTQDGSALANNLFIADTGNQRIQRWDSGGYTYWAAAAAATSSPPASAPTNVSRPAISGTPAVGQTLTCSTGTWTGDPTSYTRTWNRDGTAISGATGSTYTVVAADAGHQLTCAVKAVNATGTSAAATSDPVTVASATSAPANSVAPSITGTATTGQTVTCQPGTWTGSPSYAYRFLRDGTTQVGSASTYTIVAADVGHAITCVVTATNAGGSTSATSAPVTPTAPITCPGRVGVSINSGGTYTANQAVTLTIKPPTGATSVLIANDGGFANATTQALAGNCAYTWTLAVSGTERLPKTVYVRFAGSGFDNNQTFTDDIVLDKTAPSVTTSRVARSTATSTAKLRAVRTTKARKVSWVLAVKAKDATSGVGRLQYAARRGAKGRTVTYRARLTVSSPAAARWVRVIDRAGNPSRWVHTRG